MPNEPKTGTLVVKAGQPKAAALFHLNKLNPVLPRMMQHRKFLAHIHFHLCSLFTFLVGWQRWEWLGQLVCRRQFCMELQIRYDMIRWYGKILWGSCRRLGGHRIKIKMALCLQEGLRHVVTTLWKIHRFIQFSSISIESLCFVSLCQERPTRFTKRQSILWWQFQTKRNVFSVTLLWQHSSKNCEALCRIATICHHPWPVSVVEPRLGWNHWARFSVHKMALTTQNLATMYPNPLTYNLFCINEES